MTSANGWELTVIGWEEGAVRAPILATGTTAATAAAAVCRPSSRSPVDHRKAPCQSCHGQVHPDEGLAMDLARGPDRRRISFRRREERQPRCDPEVGGC